MNGDPAASSVLIVEDDPQVRTLIQHMIERAPGFTATAPTELDDWVAEAITCRPDVLLLDLMLEGRDTVAHIPQIVARCPRTMIAALTAWPAESEEQRTLHAGAFVFYEKSMLADLATYLERDLAQFRRALAGEDVVAPSALLRREVPRPRVNTISADSDPQV